MRYPRKYLKGSTIANLSPDEISVWMHLANGLTIKETCNQMAHDWVTVSRYRRRLFFIMEFKNLADLTRSAIKNNIITA